MAKRKPNPYARSLRLRQYTAKTIPDKRRKLKEKAEKKENA